MVTSTSPEETRLRAIVCELTDSIRSKILKLTEMQEEAETGAEKILQEIIRQNFPQLSKNQKTDVVEST